jgi:signal peptidase I
LLIGAAVALAVAVGAWLVLQLFVVQVFTVRAASMVPTLEPGDQVLVLRPAVGREIRRGDVVVADVRGTFLGDRPDTGPLAGSVLVPAPDDVFVVKRAIAGPGDRIACCSPDGRLVLNGEPLDEPYLSEDVVPSEEEFDVLVADGRWWLMGDNRPVSDDSRSHLGSPGGGTVSTDVIVGRVVRAAG